MPKNQRERERERQQILEKDTQPSTATTTMMTPLDDTQIETDNYENNDDNDSDDDHYYAALYDNQWVMSGMYDGGHQDD